MICVYLSISVLIKETSETLENLLLDAGVGFESLSISHLLYQFALFLAGILGDIDADVHDDVAKTISVSRNGRHTLATQAHYFAGLCSGFNLNLDFSVKSGYFYRTAQCGCGEVKQKVVYQVVFLSQEVLVWLYLNVHLDVAGGAIASACVTLSRYVDNHTAVYACGYVNLDRFCSAYNTLSTAMGALVLDGLALSTAMGTWTLSLHATKE